MATLSINLRYTYSVEDAIKSTVKELDKRQSDYEVAIKDVNRVPSSSGNLSDCNVYLKKKNSNLQKKINKLNHFKGKVIQFSKNAKAADKRVADHITDKTETFYKAVGIKTGWAARWDGLKMGCKEVWETVKNFYEKHKYLIDWVVDIAMLTIAVISLVAAIPTGGASIPFSAFAMAQAAADLFASSAALGFHIAGDDESAGKWAKRGLKDLWQFSGKTADRLLGKLGIKTNLFENLTGFAYDVANIASVLYSLGKAGKDIYEVFKKGNMRRFKIEGVKAIFGVDSTPGTSKEGYAALKSTFSLKNQKEAYHVVKNCGFIKNVKTVVSSTYSALKGDFIEVTSIGSDFKEIVKGGKSIAKSFDMKFSFGA